MQNFRTRLSRRYPITHFFHQAKGKRHREPKLKESYNLMDSQKKENSKEIHDGTLEQIAQMDFNRAVVDYRHTLCNTNN